MATCLYIASPSFSGSTLLTMLLGGHPRIATIGEMKGGQEDLTTYGCSCGALFAKCPFWTRLIEVLNERGFVYDLSDRRTMPAFRMPDSPVGDRLLRRVFGGRGCELMRDGGLRFWPGCSRRLDYLRRYTETFVDVVLQMYGASIFLDSSKDPVRIRHLAGIPSLEVSIIHLIRDGRGVVNSARKNLGLPAAQASVEWRETHLEIERLTRRLCAGRVLQVRYESLCANPDRVLATVLGFVGISESITAIEAAERELHVLGNSMRLKGLLPIRLDQSWRDEMSESDLAVFASIAGQVNATYGYGAGCDER